MRIIDPSHKILFMPNSSSILKLIERIGRTCYKSEDKTREGSAASFVDRLIRSGHHSVIEHTLLTVHFVCDRGVSHELVRHRLASYSQESTRYVNYANNKFGNEITVIRPYFWSQDSAAYQTWLEAMNQAEKSYLRLIQLGARPEEARSVLPNSLKTELIVSCNIREWRHIFSLRCSAQAHPQIRQLMQPLLTEMQRRLPVFFDDLDENNEKEQKGWNKPVDSSSN